MMVCCTGGTLFQQPTQQMGFAARSGFPATCVDKADKRTANRRMADIGAEPTTGVVPVVDDYSSICSAIFRASSTSDRRPTT
jgi:hypothetical protein